MRLYYILASLNILIISYGCNSDKIKHEQRYEIKKLHDSGQNQKALIEINRLISEQNEEDDDLFFLRARIEFGLNKLNEAKKDIEKAILINPDFPPYHNFLGKIMSSNMEIVSALEQYQITLKLDTLNTIAMNEIALILNMQGKHSLALAIINKALVLKTDIPGYYNTRGLIYERLGNYLSAIDDYSISIRIDENFPNYYFNRGVSKMYIREYSAAITDLNKAILLSDSDDVYFLNRGMAYYLLGDLNSALKDWETSSLLGNPNAVQYIDTLKRKSSFKKI